MQLMSTMPLRVMLANFGADPNNWRKAPYTFIKSRFYIEGATLVTYLFLKMKISANFTTLMYIFCGFLARLL